MFTFQGSKALAALIVNDPILSCYHYCLFRCMFLLPVYIFRTIVVGHDMWGNGEGW